MLHWSSIFYISCGAFSGSRAQAILKPLLLRRTKNSTLEGQPLLQLPAKHIEIIKLKFTDEERQVSMLAYHFLIFVWHASHANPFEQLYNVIEGRAKVQLNKFMRNGTLIKKWASRPRVN